MLNKQNISWLLGVALLIVASISYQTCITHVINHNKEFNKPTKTTWEYEIAFHDDFKLKEDLQQIGKAGWEIASTRRATSPSGMFGYEIIYKRKVQ